VHSSELCLFRTCVITKCISGSLPQRSTISSPRNLQHDATVASVDDDKVSKVSSDSRAALRSIRRALRDGRRPAICHGTVQLSSKISVYGQNQAGLPFAVQLPPADDAALRLLMDACEPAGLGHCSTDVQVRAGTPLQGIERCDTTYLLCQQAASALQFDHKSCAQAALAANTSCCRNFHGCPQALNGSQQRQVLSLLADRFASTFHLSAYSILRDVQSLLLEDAQSIRARLQRLNVYRPGRS
jgi:hypothetical protein